jgi:hypothetical protein
VSSRLRLDLHLELFFRSESRFRQSSLHKCIHIRQSCRDRKRFRHIREDHLSIHLQAQGKNSNRQVVKTRLCSCNRSCQKNRRACKLNLHRSCACPMSRVSRQSGRIRDSWSASLSTGDCFQRWAARGTDIFDHLYPSSIDDPKFQTS